MKRRHHRQRPPSPAVFALCFFRSRVARHEVVSGQRVALVPGRSVPDLQIQRNVKPTEALLAQLRQRYVIHFGGVPNVLRDATGKPFFVIADAELPGGAR